MSLLVLPAALSNNFSLPSVPLAHANVAPTEHWYPSGPFMDTEVVSIFSDETAEFNALQTGAIDLTDWPLPPSLISPLTQSSSFYVTSPISATDYFELQFMMASTYWGCSFNFGVPLTASSNGLSVNCAQDIRQGIAHLIDRSTSPNSFTNTESDIAGASVPVDVPEPQANGLTSPNPCGWDALHVELNPGCYVGNGPGFVAGGKAYTIAGSTGLGCGSETAQVACQFAYQQGFGSSDFCAAADDFIAAGLATGKDPNCVLVGLNPVVTTNPVNISARSDNIPRLNAGNAYFEGICAIFTGSFVTSANACGVSGSTTNIASLTTGPITAFPGFTTSPTSVSQSWQIYTGGFTGANPFDAPLYQIYNSNFSSASCASPGTTGCSPQTVGGGTCYNGSVGTFSAGDYLYVCNPTYDSISNQMEFGGCFAIPGDPSPGQTTPTFAACPSAGLSTNDFAISSGSTYSGIAVPLTGLTDQVPITVTSLGTFSGSGTLSATSDSPTTVGVSFPSTCSSVTITQGVMAECGLTITLASNAATSASITISLTLGSATHTLTIHVAVAGGLYSLDGLRPVLTATSAGYIAESILGSEAYTIPLWVDRAQYGYRNTFNGVINGVDSGIPQFNTWLNAYAATPNSNCPTNSPHCFIQGFKEQTHSLNPYIASSMWDFSILRNVYDTLHITNPSSPLQSIDWMTVNTKGLTNSQLTYTPPAGTQFTYRFTLRSDMFWQDGSKVTSWDVAFSYLTLKAEGAFQSSGLSALTGVTVLNAVQFDVNFNANGPLTLLNVTDETIIPGAYWSNCASTWSMDVASGNVPSNCYAVNPSYISPSFDPSCPSNSVGSNGVCTVKGILVGSGPWECISSTGELGTSCSDTGTQNPGIGHSYTLHRFGQGLLPGSTLTGSYFRSNGNLALWTWSGDVGDETHDFLNFGVVAFCFSKPVTGSTTGCGHWQEGIGGDVNGATSPVGVTQVSIIARFFGVNQISPFSWFSSSFGPRTTTVAVGTSPLGVAVNPNTYTIYVANSVDNTVSVINEALDTVEATISVGNTPVGVAVDPGTNTVYVTNHNSNSVSVIDGATNTVTTTITDPNIVAPTGIAVDTSTNPGTIYVTNQGTNTVSEINGMTHSVVSTITSSSFSVPTGVAVDTGTSPSTIYVTNFGGSNPNTVSEIVSGSVTQTFSGFNAPYGIAVNPSTHTVYVTNQSGNSVSTIIGGTVTTLPYVFNMATGIAVNPKTNTIYVVDQGSNTLSIIDGSTNSVTGTTSVGNQPTLVGVNPNVGDAVVANYASNTITIFNPGVTIPANPPVNIAAFPPTLHEGQYALVPASIAGCVNPYSPTGPTSGGYDC
jgi:YVTN family beta-propeller protein